MHLNRLRALVAVIELGGFSQAARHLGVSQPAVSQQIRALETALSTTLIRRQGEPVQATAAGRAVYSRAKQILALWEEAEQAVRDLAQQPSGRLILGASTVPATYLLPPLISRFRKAHPQVDLAVEVADSRRVREGILSGRIHLGVVGSHEPDPRLVYQPFAEDELVLIGPCSHPWSRREEVCPEELASEPFVLREEGSGTRCAMEEGLSEWGIDPGHLKVAAEVGSTEAVVAAVEAGLGISFVSRWAVTPALTLGRVRAIRVQAPPIRRRFYLVARPSLMDDPLVRAFWDLVESR